MTNCCYSPICQWIKNWFISNENQIDKECEIIANKIIPIILPLIKTEIENILDSKFPALKDITDPIVNEVL